MNKKRNRIVAGNWKMNMTYEDGRDLAMAIIDQLQPSETKVVLCTPYIHLRSVANIVNGISNMFLGAQNCHEAESGAYTGEISAPMLKSDGAHYVILGHSERREFFGETDELLARKVDQALQHGLKPIFCVGEKLEVREAGKHEELVAQQLRNGLFHLKPEQFREVVIAYEPVWAIGTGKTASPEQAQEMHRHIRALVAKKYKQEVADMTSILYGGSCKPSNAVELFSQPDVDGGLIGGASLQAGDFVAIIQSA